MNIGPDILTYGSCKKTDIVNTAAFGSGFNYSSHKLSNSIYASTIIEKQTYIPTTLAHMQNSSGEPEKNTISEYGKMTYYGNAFLPCIGIQVNLSREVNTGEVALSIPLTIKGHM